MLRLPSKGGGPLFGPEATPGASGSQTQREGRKGRLHWLPRPFQAAKLDDLVKSRPKDGKVKSSRCKARKT